MLLINLTPLDIRGNEISKISEQQAITPVLGEDYLLVGR